MRRFLSSERQQRPSLALRAGKLRAGALFLALAAAVAGCGESPKPEVTPTEQAYLAAPALPSAPQSQPGYFLRSDFVPAHHDMTWPPLVTGLDFNAAPQREFQALAASENFPAALRDGLTFEQYLNAVLARNAAAKALRAEERAQRAMQGQLEATDRLMAIYAAFRATLDGPEPPPYPLPGQSGLRARLVEAEAGMARAEWEATLRKNLREAREWFIDEFALAQQARLWEEYQRLVRTMRDVEQASFEAGKGRLENVLALTAEVARADNSRAEIGRLIQRNRAKIADVLALDLAAVIGPFKPAPAANAATGAEFSARLPNADRHPEVIKAALEIDALGLQASLLELLARPARLPDAPSGPEGANPWQGVAEAYRAEVLHRQAAAQANWEAMRQRMRLEARDMFQQYLSAAADVALNLKVAELKERETASLLAGSNAGITPLALALIAMQQNLEARLTATEADAHRQHFLAHFDELLGPQE